MAAPLVLGLWSIVLKPGEVVSQSTTPAIQITNISYGAEVKGNARSAVIMKYPEFEQDSDDEDEEEEEDNEEGPIKLPNLITKETVLAVLKPNGTEQVSINVNLVEDVEVVELSVTGENPVHLVGHYIRQEDFDQEPYSDEEGAYDSEDFDEDSDFDEEEMEGLVGGSEEDESMEDAADRIKELIEEQKPKASKKRAADESAADDSTVSAADVAGLSKNQQKKLAKKQKAESGEAVAAPSPAAKKAAEAPTPKKAEEKKKAEAPKKAANQTRVLQGGLEVTDAKEGTGAACKSGQKVGMRYIGKLENGKVFDSNTKGAPLTFNLGRGEVIKGWDLGVVGMKVGGERKLKIPAALAYGKQKIPGIPANSTLLFDVKLVNIK
ncbi:hypothetical protein JCM8547_005984 [Rhodosporidiobolus lusitaniae]